MDRNRDHHRPARRDTTLAWTYRIAAGLFEIGWPIGLKWAQEPGRIVIAVAVVSMTISGALLCLAQKDISR